MSRHSRPGLVAVLAALVIALAPALPGSLNAVAATGRVAAASPATSHGYWFVAADGGIFSFGDAAFPGSPATYEPRTPAGARAPPPTGTGYWCVAADGGIFSFGDATFLGSSGAGALRSNIVGMAATPSGKGYWFVADDGSVFSFGDAVF